MFLLLPTKNLQYQINLRNHFIPIIVLVSSSNRYPDLKPLTDKVLNLLSSGLRERITRISK